MKLIITIDTECDDAWSVDPGPMTTDNVAYLCRFQRLCERYRFKPTYVTTYEVATDERFVEFGRDALRRSACEIGTHPHAWTTPPFVPLTSDDMRYKPYLIEYPPPLMREKIKVLTAVLEDTFACKMVSHRAGRWAMNGTYAQILAEFGYESDCSVTPLVCWPAERRPAGEPQGVPLDYRSCAAHAYHPDRDDITVEGSLGLLELPMSVVANYGPLRRYVYDRLPPGRPRGAFQRLFGRSCHWFRPHRVYRDLLRVARRKLADGADYIMFMLHSSEFMAGGSPTFKTERDIEQLYSDIEEAFEFLRGQKVSGVTCHEYVTQLGGKSVTSR